METVDEIITAFGHLLQTNHPDLNSGIVLVEQFGQDAGLAVHHQLTGDQSAIDEKLKKQIEGFLLEDLDPPRASGLGTTIIPINGEFGRAIGYIWANSKNSVSGATHAFESISKIIAITVEGQKKGSFHTKFQNIIEEFEIDNVFSAIQDALQAGLYARKVVVWELDEKVLRSVSDDALDIPVGRGFVQNALDGDVHRISNISKYDGELFIPEFFSRNQIKSAFAFPIYNLFKGDPNKYLGVVGVFYNRPNGITALDERLCRYAVDYFSLIWSLKTKLYNRDVLLSNYNSVNSFVSQAANALIDYHDINTIQIGLGSALENAEILATKNADVVEQIKYASDRLSEIRQIITNNRSVLALAKGFYENVDIETNSDVFLVDVNTEIQHEIDDIRSELASDRATIRFKNHLRNNNRRIALSDLKRVVRNLLSNSLRAISQRSTGAGKVEVLVYNPKPNKLAVRVSDNGPGIQPGELDLIFEPFYTTHSDIGGKGLGLYAVAAVAEKHGGDVRVDSKWGYYAEFEVWLDVE
jgi:signal transduction histidine kinase